MAEKLRIRCPCCGMMTDQDQMGRVEGEKAAVRVYLQKFGGKLPLNVPLGPGYKTSKRGGAPGYQEYIDITDTSSDLPQFEAWFTARAEAFLQAKKKGG